MQDRPNAAPFSGVAKRLQTRRAKRWVLGIAAAIFLVPLASVALLILNQPWLGVPLMLVSAVIWSILPFALVGFVAWIVWRSFAANRPGVDKAEGKRSTIPVQFQPVLTAASAALPPAEAFVGRPAPAQDIDMASLVEELSAQRAEIARQRSKALAKTLPIGLGGAIAIGLLLTLPQGGFNLWPVLILCLFGGLGAYIIGSVPYENAYRTLFKDTIVPRLLGRRGDMHRLKDYAADLSRAQKTGVIWPHSHFTADDAFAGTYAGYPLEIAELQLVREQAGNYGRARRRHVRTRPTLVIRLTLDRPVPATTAVRDAAGDSEGLRNTDPALQRVHLEDVVFEQVYATFSTDQVGARALLTPAVMRRMLEMADGTDLLPPALLAEGRVLLFSIAAYGERNLFEPLSVAEPDMAKHVAALDKDLGYIFTIVDAMIDMAGALPGRASFPSAAEPSP